MPTRAYAIIGNAEGIATLEHGDLFSQPQFLAQQVIGYGTGGVLDTDVHGRGSLKEVGGDANLEEKRRRRSLVEKRSHPKPHEVFVFP
jgi:hypothetical protein